MKKVLLIFEESSKVWCWWGQIPLREPMDFVYQMIPERVRRKYPDFVYVIGLKEEKRR